MTHLRQGRAADAKPSDAVACVQPRPRAADGRGVEEALKALTVLGYAPVDAERALRSVLKSNGARSAQELIRAALAELV